VIEIGKRRGIRSDRWRGAPGSARRSVAADGRLSRVLRAWALSYAALWACTVGSAALVVIIPGAPAVARESLRLSLEASRNPPPNLGSVASIVSNNTLHSIWPLLLGVVDAQRRQVTRVIADGAVLANLLVAGLLVGGAVGGTGRRFSRFLCTCRSSGQVLPPVPPVG
jgi:hypothetical protein